MDMVDLRESALCEHVALGFMAYMRNDRAKQFLVLFALIQQAFADDDEVREVGRHT